MKFGHWFITHINKRSIMKNIHLGLFGIMVLVFGVIISPISTSAQTYQQTISTDAGTLKAGISTDPASPKSGEQSKLKILEDTGKIKKESSILVLGVLIVEDIIAVILIATLESVALVGTVSYESIILVVVVAGGLIGGTLTVGTRVIPKLIDRVAATEHKEILLLSVLGLCFGYALFANVIGLSVAIGAFLAGVLVAESKSAEVSKILSSPIKDMFVAIFFVSVGALMNISELESHIVLAFGIIALAIGVKFGGAMLGTYLFRQGRAKSLRSAFALAGPRGEFSIVIVKTGVDIGAVSSFLFPLVGIISIISAFISPFLIRASDKIVAKTGEE